MCMKYSFPTFFQGKRKKDIFLRIVLLFAHAMKSIGVQNNTELH